MICLKCGKMNPDTEKFCQHCGKRLPDASLLTVMKTPNVIDSLLKKTIKMVKDFESGQLPVEEYVDQLVALNDHFIESRNNVQEDAKEDDYEAYSPDEMNFGYRGIDLWMEGIEELLLFADTQDITYMNSGLKKIQEGNDLVNKAMYYNELKRDTEGSSGLI